MRPIKWNKTCKCILCVIIFSPLMFYGWKESKFCPWKRNSEAVNSSLLHGTTFAREPAITALTFQWGQTSMENVKGTLPVRGQKDTKVAGSNVPSNHQTSQETFVKRQLKKIFKVWNADTSSKDLIRRLQKIRLNHLKINLYKVTFPERNTRRKHSASDLLCKLKNVDMDMVKRTDLPSNGSDWTVHLPTNTLSAVVGNLTQCAIVSSAGAIRSSRLGREIDGHDAVLRFNAAPIKGYETDVGTKTTVRLVNSQLVTDPIHHFPNDTLYQSGTLIMWDPAPYHASLHEWYKQPEYNFSENYKIYRTSNPTQPFYIINPNVMWKLWDIIQANTLEDIQPNPPSSGMIGIVLMMGLCDEVNIYEYLPSKRKTDLCHYYERFFDSACLLGAFHPLTFEKNLIKQINQGTDEDIYLYGKVTLPGFSKVKC